MSSGTVFPDVHSLDLIADLQGEAQTLFRDAGPAVQGNDDKRLSEVVDAYGAIDDNLAADAVVVAFDCTHEDDQRGNKDGRDPSTFPKLRNQYDQQGDPG